MVTNKQLIPCLTCENPITVDLLEFAKGKQYTCEVCGTHLSIVVESNEPTE